MFPRLTRLESPMRKTGIALLAAAALGSVTLSACTSEAGGGGKGGGTFTTIDGQHQLSAGAPMNPFNAEGNSFPGYDDMQLGFQKYSATDPNDYFPGLAKSWTLSDDGTALTVQLQPDAKWSDGSKVTFKDVQTSMALAFTQGNATARVNVTQGLDLAQVKDLGDGKIELDQVAGGKNVTFTATVLKQHIVADSVYGKLLPADIWDIIAATEYVGPDKAKVKAAEDAVAKLTSVGKDVSKFAPAKDISAGPFSITRVNPGAALLSKNKNFYDADKIDPAQVVIRNYSGNQQIWNYLTSGQLDASPYTSMPTNVLNRILARAGNKRVDSVSFVSASLAFNQSSYPYNLLPVRQALAYVIDRKNVTKVGEPVGGTASVQTTGVISSALKDWLDADQAAKLNPYEPNAAKATQLLQGAGFTKSGSQWKLPNGKPWTLNIQTVNGFSDWIQAASVLKSQLNGFGIKTDVSTSPDYATYLADQSAGKFAVGFWLCALGPAMDTTFQRLYGKDDGFTVNGSGVVHVAPATKGAGNWQGGPTNINVPGVGDVAVGELTAQLSTLPAEQQKPLVQKLVLATNYALPAIQLWDYTNVQFTSDTRFTDFPSGPDGLLRNSPGVWMMQGYVHKK
jgi:peptide/nickel transport system substrate-binding protein